MQRVSSGHMWLDHSWELIFELSLNSYFFKSQHSVVQAKKTSFFVLSHFREIILIYNYISLCYYSHLKKISITCEIVAECYKGLVMNGYKSAGITLPQDEVSAKHIHKDIKIRKLKIIQRSLSLPNWII